MAFPTNPSPGDSYTDGYGTVWVYAGTVNGWYRQSVSTPNDTSYTAAISGPAGSNTQVQFNNGGNLSGSADLTWDDTAKELGVGGDINLDDGGTYATTLQLITPTANRTISFPDATGTVGLVGGSSGQLIYNNAGAYAGAPSTSVGATGNIALSLAGAASTPPVSLTGTWFSGGTSTTTKPQLLIEPVGTTSTAWSTDGTGLGVNAASGFAGNLLDLQVNGSSKVRALSNGSLESAKVFSGNELVNYYQPYNGGANQAILATSGSVNLIAGNSSRLLVKNTGQLQLVSAFTVGSLPVSPQVGDITRVTDATTPAVGSNVVGGGAAAALVWYNGTNWTVIGV